MRLLIIGGTRFVGRHIAEAALQRGHTVTVFHRGSTDSDVLPDAEHLLGDRDQELNRLAGRHWDATIDTCAYVPRQVRELADALRGRGGRHAFVSSVSVYAEPAPPDLDEDAALAGLDDPSTENVTDETYGGLKALCEQVITERYPEPLVIRPTYVVGPHDHTHRFTYWVNRIADGGRVLAPDLPDYQIQVVDARDQGRWVIELLERGEAGTFHTVSPAPPFTFADMLDAIADAIAPAGTEIVPVDPQFLEEQGVDGNDLPLWYPGTEAGDPGLSCDPSRAAARGFSPRPLAQSVREILDHERTSPTPNPDGVGWTRADEQQVLAAWDARS